MIQLVACSHRTSHPAKSTSLPLPADRRSGLQVTLRFILGHFRSTRLHQNHQMRLMIFMSLGHLPDSLQAALLMLRP